MKFRSLAEITNIQWTDEEEYSEKYFEFEDRLKELTDQADVIRITLLGGKVHIAGTANKAGGTCGCCSKFSRSDIAKYEFFVLG